MCQHGKSKVNCVVTTASDPDTKKHAQHGTSKANCVVTTVSDPDKKKHVQHGKSLQFNERANMTDRQTDRRTLPMPTRDQQAQAHGIKGRYRVGHWLSTPANRPLSGALGRRQTDRQTDQSICKSHKPTERQQRE